MRLLLIWSLLLAIFVIGCDNGGGDDFVPSSQQALNIFPSESGTIQIHPSEQVVYAINRETGTMTAVRVRLGGLDTLEVLGEIPVGNEPRSISISPAGTKAYVSNGADGTVSVVNLGGGFGPFSLEAVITVGSEPRGTALSPSGRTLYVANYSDGSVSVIDTLTNTVASTIDLGGSNDHPYAVAVSNNFDGVDTDETIAVSNFFARPVSGTPVDSIEGNNNGKEGFIYIIDAGTNTLIGTIPISPRNSGFTEDQTVNCVANGAVSDIFCGSSTSPQSAFANQLNALTTDPNTNKIYVPSIAASPEPPVNFNTNIQAFISVVDPSTNTEIASEGINLNTEIATENGGVPTAAPSLVRTFAGDIVAMAIRNGVAVIVSRSGSFVFEAGFDASGVLTLNPPSVVRYSTTNLPNGAIMDSRGERAYINGEFGEITAIDLVNNVNIGNIETTTLPAPGSIEMKALIGKLVFFTGMGVPPDVPVENVRAINTHNSKGLASSDNWSSCGSCHPDGLSDGVTWIFPTGPRQTIPLDGSYAPQTPENQRVFNWNAVRGSVTDFNNNSRNIQGGIGFTPGGDVDAGIVFNHGPNQGVSEALDFNTLWVQVGIRTHTAPTNLNQTAVASGRLLFSANCAQCHGGPKWSSSQVRWAYPLFASNPLAPGGALVLDTKVLQLGTGPIITAYDDSAISGTILDVISGSVAGGGTGNAVGTLDLTLPNEIRGGGALIGQSPPGAAGSFNPPSLLGVHNTAPYCHSGRAQTLEEVFVSIAQGGAGHNSLGLSAEQLTDVLEFLRSIDGNEPPQ